MYLRFRIHAAPTYTLQHSNTKSESYQNTLQLQIGTYFEPQKLANHPTDY